MRNFVAVTLACAWVMALGVLAAQAPQSAGVPPPWAFGFTTPPPPGPPPAPPAPAAAPAAPAAAPDPTPHKLAGSTATFTLAEVRNPYGPADWFPGDHPAMPDIVARGKKEQQVLACSLCHYPNGKGRPENSGVSGLPYRVLRSDHARFQERQEKELGSQKGEHQSDDRLCEGHDRR